MRKQHRWFKVKDINTNTTKTKLKKIYHDKHN